MTRDELLAYFDEAVKALRETLVKKNADYAGGAQGVADCFANFTRVESLGIATTEQGFMTRMTDKLMRINSLTKQPAQVASETITDTLMDLANYSILFSAFLSQKRLRASSPLA